MRDVTETCGDIGGQKVFSDTVSPVTVGNTGDIHTIFTALTEQILYRSDGNAGRGAETGADKVPADLGTVRVHIAADLIPDVLRRMVVPACGGVIVMGAGVADTVVRLIVRKITAVIVLKGKLQDLHALQPVTVSERPDFIG